MPDSHIDYFQSAEHELLLKHHIETEMETLRNIIQEDGVLAGVSRIIAILGAYPAFLKSLGLKNVAVELLRDALKEARKGEG